MKRLFTFLLSFIGVAAMAQDRWKVCLDRTVLLNTATEDTGKNVIALTAARLNRAKNFTVSYKESEKQKRWERSLLVFDGQDQELQRQAGPKLTLKASALKNLLETHHTIKIYTISSPTDPRMKAQVRIRRVHLCTLVSPS